MVVGAKVEVGRWLVVGLCVVLGRLVVRWVVDRSVVVGREVVRLVVAVGLVVVTSGVVGRAVVSDPDNVDVSLVVAVVDDFGD